MIIDFDHSCNTYSDIKGFFGTWEYDCPNCRAKHSFTRHGFYSRYLIYWNDDKGVCETRIDILRLRCTSCGTTHAVLTGEMIPFIQFSFSFIVALLDSFYDGNTHTPALEEMFSIPYQTIYRLVSMLRTYESRIILILRLSVWNHRYNPEISEILSLSKNYFPHGIGPPFFKNYKYPLFLMRNSTVSYPLYFGSKISEYLLTT